MARWISSPIIALPTGSWRAKGRRCSGCTGGRDGFGIMKSHPFFHELGMIGGLNDHQNLRCSCNMGARKAACCLQTMPGANGFATAREIGIKLRAFWSWWTVKGTPGAWSKVKSRLEGPAQVSATNLYMMAALSTGLASWPAVFLNWICFRGCLGANLLIKLKSLCVSWWAAAAAAVLTISLNCCCLMTLACFLCKRFSFRKWITWNHFWNRSFRSPCPGLSIRLRCSHLFRIMGNAGTQAGSMRCVDVDGKWSQKVCRICRCIVSISVSASWLWIAKECASCVWDVRTNCCQAKDWVWKASRLVCRCCSVILCMCLCAKVGIQYLAIVLRMGVCPTSVCCKNGESQI